MPMNYVHVHFDLLHCTQGSLVDALVTTTEAAMQAAGCLGVKHLQFSHAQFKLPSRMQCGVVLPSSPSLPVTCC